MFFKGSFIFALFILLGTLSGCPPKGDVLPVIAPGITFIFPDGVTCPSDDIVITPTARVVNFVSSDPHILIKVCLVCGSGDRAFYIGGAIVKGDLTRVTLPPSAEVNFTGFTKKEEECFEKRISLVRLPYGVTPIEARGRKIMLEVLDGDTPHPTPISSFEVTIE